MTRLKMARVGLLRRQLGVAAPGSAVLQTFRVGMGRMRGGRPLTYRPCVRMDSRVLIEPVVAMILGEIIRVALRSSPPERAAPSAGGTSFAPGRGPSTPGVIPVVIVKSGRLIEFAIRVIEHVVIA